MQNNVNYSLVLQPGQWAFYIMDITGQNLINVVLNETTPGAQSVLLRMYASWGTFPTSYIYGYAAPISTQSLKIESSRTGSFYVGVYFPVTASWPKPASFDIIGNATGLCQHPILS